MVGFKEIARERTIKLIIYLTDAKMCTTQGYRGRLSGMYCAAFGVRDFFVPHSNGWASAGGQWTSMAGEPYSFQILLHISGMCHLVRDSKQKEELASSLCLESLTSETRDATPRIN